MTFTEDEYTLLMDILDDRLASTDCELTKRLKKKISIIGLHDYFKSELNGDDNDNK